MKQGSPPNSFEKFRKKTRKKRLQDDIEAIIPWKERCEAIDPFYRNPRRAGRRPIGIDRILRIYFLQHWFNMSYPAAEEAIYDSRAMRQFVGIDSGEEPAPDETIIWKFRHLMKNHNLGDFLFHPVNKYLKENGLKISRGTIVDASVIIAPSSPKNKNKNKKKQRDPEMRQIRKGNQWYFVMHSHIGVDSRTKLTHSVVATPANADDSVVVGDLLHGHERRVCGDSAHSGKGEVIAAHAPDTKDFTNKKARRYVELKVAEHSRNRNKSKVRAKVRYKGLDKNTHHPFVSSALVDLVMAKKALLPRNRLLMQA